MLRGMDTTITIAGFSVGVTQIFKELGVQGQWLKLVCVLAGCAAWAVQTLDPALWQHASSILIALGSTGLVSFVDERIQILKSGQ
jgi:hypothetical protein